MPYSDITQPEIVRWLIRLEEQQKTNQAAIIAKLDNLTFVSKEIYNRDMDLINERLDAIEGEKKWKGQQVFQMILTGLIAPTIMLVIGFIILRLGQG